MHQFAFGGAGTVCHERTFHSRRFRFIPFCRARAPAADYNWKSPVSGSAGTASNWTPTGVPGQSDRAIFNLGSAGYTVSPGNAFVGQVYVNNDTVTVTRSLVDAVEPNLPAIQLGNNSGDMAKLTLTDSVTLMGNEIWIGAQANTQGTITINQGMLSTSTFQPGNSPAQIVVGAAGTGTLSVLTGTVQEIGTTIIARDALSHGTFSLDGSDSLYYSLGSGLTVGQGGVGTFSLTQDSVAYVAGNLMVGEDAGSNGTINVASQSTLTSALGSYVMQSATIGGAGTGELDVTGGGKAYLLGPLVVGQAQGSEGTVIVDGSQSTLAPFSSGTLPKLSLTVGDAGAGTMSVLNGAQTSLGGTITIGNSAGSMGHFIVDGAGSHVQSAQFGSQSVDKMIVGASGNGTLSVTGGGVVDLINANVYVAQNAGSMGTIEVASGSQLIANNLDIGAVGTGLVSIGNGSKVRVWTGPVENHAGGTIDLQGGTLQQYFDNTNVEVHNSGTLDNNGTVIGNVTNLPTGIVSGSGTITGTLSNQGGMLAPGNSPGTLSAGSLDFQSGTLQIEMNRAMEAAGGPAGWDLLNIQGTAALAGPLQIELVSLSPNDQPGNVYDFNPLQDYQWLFLNASGGITGFDASSFAIDLSHFSNAYSGQFFVTEVGNALLLNYSVPEPATLVLAGVGLVLFAGAARRRRRS